MSDEILLKNEEFVPAEFLAEVYPLKVLLHQAHADHKWNLFSQSIYHPHAKLWMHRDLAEIVAFAAINARKQFGWTLHIHDSLRPVEAQSLMAETEIVRANPHWLQEPRLLSPAGKGAHPRGMAVDVTVTGREGQIIDMGTHMDELTAGDNKNARNYQGFPQEVLDNRKKLEALMVEAGNALGRAIMPLANEWWDFRFYPEDTNRFAPRSDASAPDYMKMLVEPAAIPDDIAALMRATVKGFRQPL